MAVTLRRLLTSLGTPAGGEVGQGAGRPTPAAEHEQIVNLQARRRVQLADLTPAQLQTVFLATMAILALGVAVYCRPVGSRRGPKKVRPRLP